jgi:hypothetical protein
MAADPETVRAAELRVLQVIPILAMGGLERVATSLTLGLRPLVARVAVAGCTGVKELGSVEIEKPLRDGGVTIYHIPRAQRRLIDVLRAGIALVPVYRRERPDVVHAHNPSGGAAASLARILSLRLSTTIVTTYHGVEPQRLARATRVLSLTSDLVVGVGPTATRALERIGLPTDRSATVYNACSVPSSRGAEDIRREFAIHPRRIRLFCWKRSRGSFRNGPACGRSWSVSAHSRESCGR